MTFRFSEKEIMMPNVTIHVDGACLGNPGVGGYGVVLLYKGHRRECSGGFRETTNNRMELMAAIVGLEALKRSCIVTVYSDSRYVVDAMEKGWAKRWERRGWMKSDNKAVANADLWRRLLALCDEHQVEFVWNRGHSGLVENEHCDALAKAVCQQEDLPMDEGYEIKHKVDEETLFAHAD